MPAYTIIAASNNPFGPEYYTTANSAKQAEKVAREICKEHPELSVYVTLHRAKDNASCYLNPCGNHDSVGYNWNN